MKVVFKTQVPDLSLLKNEYVNSIKASKFLKIKAGSRAMLYLLREAGLLEVNNKPSLTLEFYDVESRTNLTYYRRDYKTVTYTVHFSARSIQYLNEWIEENRSLVKEKLKAGVKPMLEVLVF